jgi:hypothetical protein
MTIWGGTMSGIASSSASVHAATSRPPRMRTLSSHARSGESGPTTRVYW